jgi:hypothetical protein
MQTDERTQTHDMGMVDEIRSRMNATYSEAMHALDEGQGDLLRALAIIEDNRKAAGAEEFDLIERIFSVAEDGISGVKLKVGSKYERKLTIGMGAIGSLLAALLVGFFNEIKLEAIRNEE